jgi:small-conductance mechanosensitive channel
MDAEIMSASGVGLEITELLMPFISALVLLVITLWFKDFATKVAKGLAFSMNKSFNEGDSVILDGQEAIIVKIGLSESVFGIYSDRGYTWRYVPNERIPMLKLEKVINKDAFQDNNIEKNKSDIEKIKNGRKKRV